MRFLIGAACFVVIAFVGYFFWCEYSERVAIENAKQAHESAMFKAAQDREAAISKSMQALEATASKAAQAKEATVARARAELFRLADADEGEENMVTAWCKLAEMRTSDGPWKGHAHIERAVRNCRTLGYL